MSKAAAIRKACTVVRHHCIGTPIKPDPFYLPTFEAYRYIGPMNQAASKARLWASVNKKAALKAAIDNLQKEIGIMTIKKYTFTHNEHAACIVAGSLSEALALMTRSTVLRFTVDRGEPFSSFPQNPALFEKYRKLAAKGPVFLYNNIPQFLEVKQQ